MDRYDGNMSNFIKNIKIWKEGRSLISQLNFEAKYSIFTYFDIYFWENQKR